MVKRMKDKPLQMYALLKIILSLMPREYPGVITVLSEKTIPTADTLARNDSFNPLPNNNEAVN